MKKKIALLIATVGVVSSAIFGCANYTAKHLGGDMVIELEPGIKLEEITWKDDSLWYLTRPMNENDIAETHTFQEKSNMGIIEGTITIIESK